MVREASSALGSRPPGRPQGGSGPSCEVGEFCFLRCVEEKKKTPSRVGTIWVGPQWNRKDGAPSLSVVSFVRATEVSMIGKISTPMGCNAGPCHWLGLLLFHPVRAMRIHPANPTWRRRSILNTGDLAPRLGEAGKGQCITARH